MTVHPFRPAVPDGDPFDAAPRLEEPDPTTAALEALLDLLPDRFEELDELVEGLVDSRDRFGSFDRDRILAHRAVTPGLLAGFCWLELGLCGAFHAAMFQLLEAIGGSNGLIATSSYFADARSERMRDASEWLFDHPAPTTSVESFAARDAIAAHSSELAVAIGSNPSLTFASSAALRERLIDDVLEIGERDLVVTDQQIDWLADLTLRLLSELRHDVAIVGGVRVWAAPPGEVD